MPKNVCILRDFGIRFSFADMDYSTEWEHYDSYPNIWYFNQAAQGFCVCILEAMDAVAGNEWLRLMVIGG